MRLVGIILVAAVIGSIDCTCQKIGSFVGVGYNKEFYYESDKKTWDSAQQSCVDQGKEPLLLLTKDEETKFLHLIGSNEIFPNNGILPYFIGGIKYGNNWVWTKTLTQISYKIKWNPGEPSSKGVENCLSVIKRGTDDVGINDTLCETFVAGFFCQKVIKDWEEEHKIGCLID